jgi:hypothetical protein
MMKLRTEMECTEKESPKSHPQAAYSKKVYKVWGDETIQTLTLPLGMDIISVKGH